MSLAARALLHACPASREALGGFVGMSTWLVRGATRLDAASPVSRTAAQPGREGPRRQTSRGAGAMLSARLRSSLGASTSAFEGKLARIVTGRACAGRTVEPSPERQWLTARGGPPLPRPRRAPPLRAASSSAASQHALPPLGTLEASLSALSPRVDACWAAGGGDELRDRLERLEREAEGGDLWSDPERAGRELKRIAGVRSELEALRGLVEMRDDASVALELAQLEAQEEKKGADGSESGGGGERGGAPAASPSLHAEAAEAVEALATALDAWEDERLLGGVYDDRPALVSITAGAGGADAADWAGMLASMYSRWGAGKGMTVSTLDSSPAEKGGYKSIELRFEGPRAYGLLRGERGAHRLVRSSPFNAKGLRQTSFAGVGVAPELREEDYLRDPELKPLLQLSPADLSFETMRASGAGGQHVNTTDSAVRVRHLPTGLSARCEAERSQARNKEGALRALRAKLAQRARALRADMDRKTGGQPVEASWGNQVRNYVLTPYSLVKDAATGLETADVAGVLDGTGLDAFIKAGARARKERERREGGESGGREEGTR